LRPADDDLLRKIDELMEVARKAGRQHYLKCYFTIADGMLHYRHGESPLAKKNNSEAEERFSRRSREGISERAENLQ